MTHFILLYIFNIVQSKAEIKVNIKHTGFTSSSFAGFYLGASIYHEVFFFFFKQGNISEKTKREKKGTLLSCPLDPA